MSLPKVSQPISTFEVPSNKTKIKMRPMKVSDEKILLIAKEAKSPFEIYNAVRQVVNNCIVEPNFNIRTLATFDIDYLFLKLRAISIGKDIVVTYLDYEDNKEYGVKIDLDKVDIQIKTKETTVKVGNNTLQLKYPSCMVYELPIFSQEDVPPSDLFDEFVIQCLDKYFEGDTIYNFADYKREDLKEFVNDLDLKSYEKIKLFVENLPSLYHESKYVNSKGTEQTIKSTTLNDFFTF